VPDDDLKSILARAKMERGVSPSGTSYKSQTKYAKLPWHFFKTTLDD
jgi:hypothetical protein